MNDTTKTTDIAGAAEKPKLLPVVDDSEFSELLDSNRFGQIQRVANLFSQSDLVPEVFQGKPANCAVALQMAFRMRIDPMMLMQNMYIVYGRPGIEAKLAIALINQRGPFTGPLQWRFEGEGTNRSCTCYATHKVTGEKCEARVTWKMVKDEGWLDKKGSKWQTMPDIMFQYRTATFLGRLYCPEVILGLPTGDELHDVGRMTVVSGERVDEGVDVISLPRAKSDPQSGAPTVTGDGSGKAIEGESSSQERLDTGTGEVTNGGQPALELGSLSPEMTKRASDAQRNMIIGIAKRNGLTTAQLDEHLIARFAIGIDELPIGLVSDATSFVKDLKSAA